MDSPARKKNRTDTISADDFDRTKRNTSNLKDAAPLPTCHLPAPVWGHALDYMPYNEVRSALLICMCIANEAVQHVQTVSFTKACQLDAPALRRFSNITEVKCLCLIHGDFSSTTLCEDTVFRIVPLLTALPRLERFFIGGIYNGQMHTPIRYIQDIQDIQEGDRTPRLINLQSVNTLFYNFLGAFKGRLFASTLESTNLCTLFCSHYYHLGPCDSTDRGLCRACKGICSYFPLRDAIKRCSLKIGCMKQSKALVRSLEIIGNREGAKDIFTEQQNFCCLLLLPFLRGLESFNFDKHPEEGKLLKRVLSNRNVLFIPFQELEHLDRMISLGISPMAIPKNAICKVMHNRSNVMIKSTFDALVRRGFALDEEDFIVLDERVEPALQCVLGQLHERDEDADNDER